MKPAPDRGMNKHYMWKESTGGLSRFQKHEKNTDETSSIEVDLNAF
jgi:hypothetical protein